MKDANDMARKLGTAALRKEIDRSAAPRPPAYSDDAIALIFAEKFSGQKAYVASFGKWYFYDGMRWRPDETLETSNQVRKVCRKAAADCRKGGLSLSLASASTVAAVERLARSDRRLFATPEQWDQDPWLLNTPGGVVELRTGEIRPHRSEDFLTKLTGATPDPCSSTPNWLRFLDQIGGGDKELIDFLQRMAGYALTGVTTEHALFFLYGTGSNGKSTFLNALTAAIGDYHKTSPIETFTATASDRHPTDLAGLRGARLVVSVETEEGRRWAESKIKSLTGGDRIAARFMRQDFFEFTPIFKLIVAGNHKPSLRSVDEAIRRRFHLVPFTTTIPEGARDKHLGDRLKDELPGILAWAVAGCLMWQAQGLNPPDVVRDATDAYLEAEDALAAWMEDVGEKDPNAWESSTALFQSWKSWCDRTGEIPGSLKKFSQRLEDRGGAIGMRKGRDGQGNRGFHGLRLRRPSEPSDESEAVPL